MEWRLSGVGRKRKWELLINKYKIAVFKISSRSLLYNIVPKIILYCILKHPLID
jgi:hypothetical protein